MIFDNQVCDGQWHHYAVSMESSNVQLYVDGHPLTGSKNHPEIIDDWPLHSSHGLTTILTVGACWQGRTFILKTLMYWMNNSIE